MVFIWKRYINSPITPNCCFASSFSKKSLGRKVTFRGVVPHSCRKLNAQVQEVGWEGEPGERVTGLGDSTLSWLLARQ